MISNRFYRIPPFSVKPEITRVEIFPLPWLPTAEQEVGKVLPIYCHEQRPMSRKIKKILIKRGLAMRIAAMVLDIAAFHYINDLFRNIGGQIRDTLEIMGYAHQGQSPGNDVFFTTHDTG